MKKKTWCCLLAVWMIGTSAWSQEQGDSVMKRSFWDNWFVQFGADMTIQAPYGYSKKDALSKGRSYGVDIALGKWFTREIGMKGKLNWENGLIDSEAEWLAPFHQPGMNHHKGGYLAAIGDVMLDLHNTFGTYREDRFWNTMLFFRAGGVYNFGCDKGSPLIGLGWGNRFRLSERWGLYAELAYNGVSSGFTMDERTSTGTGNHSNMFFTFDVGVSCQLGDKEHRTFDAITPVNNLRDKSFWKNWFLQFGADMTLYNPCEKNFSDVIPDGMAFGVDVAVGKWFAPELGLRGRINLENAIIENKSLKWWPYDKEKHSSCYDGGGCLMTYMDVMVGLKHVLMGYVPGERWNMYVFGRMGLGKNFSIDSLSPVVGAGLGATYRLNNRWSLYADTAYEGITSEFFGGVSWSGATGAAFNGIWDFNIGVEMKL